MSFFFRPRRDCIFFFSLTDLDQKGERGSSLALSFSRHRHVGLYLDVGTVRQPGMPQVAADLQGGGRGARGAAMVSGVAQDSSFSNPKPESLSLSHFPFKRPHSPLRRFCEMNPDVTYASCDAPQEKTDKEVELDEDGNEVSNCLFVFVQRQSLSFRPCASEGRAQLRLFATVASKF